MNDIYWPRIIADLDACNNEEFLDIIYSAQDIKERKKLLNQYLLARNSSIYKRLEAM